MRQVFLYIVGIISVTWGIIHLFPSKNIAFKYGKLMVENTQNLTMEWIIESIIMILLGLLILGLNIPDYKKNNRSKATKLISTIALAVLLLLSLYSYPV
jgi:small-conductance mechanosensitive channel